MPFVDPWRDARKDLVERLVGHGAEHGPGARGEAQLIEVLRQGGDGMRVVRHVQDDAGLTG
jgi:hypothetical protein